MWYANRDDITNTMSEKDPEFLRTQGSDYRVGMPYIYIILYCILIKKLTVC